jgi:hypothetical protein
MPSLPFLIVESNYLNSTPPSISNTGAQLFYTSNAGIAINAHVAAVAVDMGVQLVIPEGYVVLVTTAGGSGISLQNNRYHYNVTTAVYTPTSTFTGNFTIILNNISSINGSNIPSNYSIAQLNYLKASHVTPLIKSS